VGQAPSPMPHTFPGAERRHRWWGSQFWLQPAFSRLSPGRKTRHASKEPPKGGCGQNCPPHHLCRRALAGKVCGVGLPACSRQTRSSGKRVRQGCFQGCGAAAWEVSAGRGSAPGIRRPGQEPAPSDAQSRAAGRRRRPEFDRSPSGGRGGHSRATLRCLR
jgi:hypothetical protein